MFKELTSVKSRKKDISLREVFEKDGVIAKTERRSFYFIKDIAQLKNETDLQKWLDPANTARPANKRQFYVLKVRNDTLGEDKILCKIAGTFYAILGNKVYTIAFMNSFKVSFVKAHLLH